MNLKKALKHDVEVAGKTIPTMILVGLFLVGGGSAALLATYDTVSGTATVDQRALTVDGTSVSYDQQFVAGQTFHDVFEVTNNADVEVPYVFETYATKDDSQTGSINGIDVSVHKPGSVEHALKLTEGTDSDTATVTKAFDSSEDQVTLTVGGVEHSSQDQPVTKTFLIDEDADGTVDYQVRHYGDKWQYAPHNPDNEDAGNYGYVKWRDMPDYINTEVSDFDGDDTDEYRVSIAADELGEEFRYGIQSMEHGTGDQVNYPADTENGPFDWTSTSDFPTALTVEPGDEVSSDQSVSVDASNHYVLVSEFAINLKTATDGYNVGVEVNPDTEGENYQEPE